MRICQIIPEFYMGGAEAMCITLAAELQKMGHDVCIVSLRTYESVLSERARSYNIELQFMDKTAGLDLRCIPRLRKFLLMWKPDVIHVHLHALKYAYFAAYGLGIPFVRTTHAIAAEDTHGADRVLYKILLAGRKIHPVSLTKAVQDTIVDAYKIPAEFAPIIFNGVDLNKCLPKTDYAIHGIPHIIHVGSFIWDKNQAGIVRAVSILKTRGIIVHADLLGEGKRMQEVKALAESLDIQNQVTFHGLCANVFPELGKSDIFLLPTLISEGSPISIIEAMGTGLPIVASNVGGIPDMISDSHDGILINPEDEIIADTLEMLLKDEALRKKLGENAKDSANRFSAVTMAEKYVELYTQLIG